MSIYNEKLEIIKAGKFHRLKVPDSIASCLGIDMPSDFPGPLSRKRSVSGECTERKQTLLIAVETSTPTLPLPPLPPQRIILIIFCNAIHTKHSRQIPDYYKLILTITCCLLPSVLCRSILIAFWKLLPVVDTLLRVPSRVWKTPYGPTPQGFLPVVGVCPLGTLALQTKGKWAVLPLRLHN